METNWQDLSVADGTTMAAFTVRPEAESHCGVLVLQEAFGVNTHIQDVAQRLAALGWWTIAPDLYHRTVARFQGDYADFRPAMPHMKAMTVEGQTADLRACGDWLRRQGVDEVSSIGFCMGGRISVLAASVLPLKASVSFYAGNILSLRERVPAISAPVLLVWGGRDEHIPPAQCDEFAGLLQAAKKTFAVCTFSDAGHGFFCDQRPSFHAPSARAAWPLATAFLRQ